MAHSRGSVCVGPQKISIHQSNDENNLFLPNNQIFNNQGNVNAISSNKDANLSMDMDLGDKIKSLTENIIGLKRNMNTKFGEVNENIQELNNSINENIQELNTSIDKGFGDVNNSIKESKGINNCSLFVFGLSLVVILVLLKWFRLL